ncbi:uncharacterized, partial [Tachysurus ichikawai]
SLDRACPAQDLVQLPDSEWHGGKPDGFPAQQSSQTAAPGGH